MIKLVIGLFLLVLFVLFLSGLVKDRNRSKKVDEAKDRLVNIKNEHKILDIEREVQEAEAKLKRRKDGIA